MPDNDPPPQVPYRYKIVDVPAGCMSAAVNDYRIVDVTEPPPATVTINMGGTCNGIIARLALGQQDGPPPEM